MASYWNEPSMSRPALLRKKERNYVNHFCRRQRVFSVYCSFQVCVSKTLQSIMCHRLSCSPQMALTICKVSLRDTLCRCGFYLLILVLPKSGCWSPSFLSVSSNFFIFYFFLLLSQRDGIAAAASNTCTYLGPGCVLSLALRSTGGCTHSRVCSCRWDTWALGRTGCASPAGSRCWRCDPACLAAQGYRGGLAGLR